MTRRHEQNEAAPNSGRLTLNMPPYLADGMKEAAGEDGTDQTTQYREAVALYLQLRDLFGEGNGVLVYELANARRSEAKTVRVTPPATFYRLHERRTRQQPPPATT